MSDLTPESFFRNDRRRDETGAVVGTCEILKIECRLRYSQGGISGDCRTCVFALNYLQEKGMVQDMIRHKVYLNRQ